MRPKPATMTARGQTTSQGEISKLSCDIQKLAAARISRPAPISQRASRPRANNAPTTTIARIVKTPRWREWLIPARILNQHGRVRQLRKDQWKQLWAKYKDASVAG